jgi:hypothetical protein
MKRLLLAWSFTGMILAAAPAVAAQAAAGPAAVRESGARAVLAGDSIRLQLPFTGAATRAGRAAVWTLSPTGAKGAEAAVNFAAGGAGRERDAAVAEG